MTKNIISYIILSMLAITTLNSQPFYYTSDYQLIDTVFDNYTSSIYRINLSNPAIVETLMTDIGGITFPETDEYGNWLAYEEYFHLNVINLNNLLQKNVISQHSEGIGKFSFVSAINKLVVLYDDNSPTLYNLVLVDPNSLTITDTIPYDVRWESSREEDIVFSQTGDVMYLMKTDTVLQKGYIASYSLSSKQIIDTKYIEELSSPSSDEFYFEFRRNGFGVVESWKRLPVSTSYYRIYFLDNDSLSITIQRDESQTWGNAYVAGNGKYLSVFKSVIPDSVNISSLTGEIDIYDMIDGEIKKTIQLPPDGDVLCFENYPNNIYYVIDIEKPTRQIYTLKMDSIFNVLNLTSLNPSSAIVNSQPFTLTVNGHGFDSLSTVHFNDTAKTTTFISDSILTAEISTSDIATVGNYPVWVTDQWAISDTLFFSVFTQPPVLSSISPGMTFRVPHSDIYFDFTVTVKGELFNDSSVVYFNGQPKTTSYVSDSLITFLVTNYEIVASGDIPVWVSNLESNSDTLYFSVADTLPHSIIPTVLCVEERAGEFTAYLGYENNNDVSVFISVGVNNSLFSWVRPFPIIAINNQPTVFVPGVVVNAFNVVFNGNEFIWRLAGVDLSVDERADKCE